MAEKLITWRINHLANFSKYQQVSRPFLLSRLVAPQKNNERKALIMGVQGLTSMLQELGWMPRPNENSGNTLWREHTVLSTLADRVELIPRGSTLAIDGNGLAHYLHNVAYSRHFAQVTSASASNGNGSLTMSQVTLCLPQSMPLSLLDEVTREFIGRLEYNQMKIVVYWDGEGRRMKAGTTQKRFDDRTTEWGHLQQYCIYGVLPFKDMCERNFRRNFPASRLLLQQVRITLRDLPLVQNVHCAEEADRLVAMASANDPSCYCVGMDSDYCLFARCKYIPFNTLDASGDTVSGCVVRREQLAQAFELPSEELMVELAILVGNDYIGHPKDAKLSFSAKTTEEALEHLRDQEPGHKVSTQGGDHIQRAIDFTRALYEFESLEDYPLDDPDEIREANERQVENNSQSERPLLPASFVLEDLAVADPLDSSIRDIVTRCIQPYIDGAAGTEETPMVSQEQLNTFLQLHMSLFFGVSKRPDTPSRPEWKDVLASYMIEKTLVHIYRFCEASMVVRSSTPMRTFDLLSFYCLMNEKRDKMSTESTDEEKKVSLDDPTGQIAELPPQQTAAPEEPPTPVQVTLPIDEHEGEILHAIETQRVTIIHGETGCGKSSRVPVMLLNAPPPDRSLPDVRFFMSQPRRIAAKSLVERVRSCEPTLRHKIALRMGHGVREYESGTTRAWFVTTGYIVRLLANHPERFDRCSHLIIDEVHERSVDTDILCLLCRRLLYTNPTIRLILMSATMAAELYQQYFDLSTPPIHVGARRFPIHEYFLEDLAREFRFPANDAKAAMNLEKMYDKTKGKTPPAASQMQNMFQIAVRVTLAVGKGGSSVLIFVPGMNEIISIMELIEKVHIPGLKYTCFPIHSDIPFEDQMAAFDSPSENEVKVVVATNSAESSITLPNVDHVICTGLCKQIVYNAASHRQMLTPAWISRASATQRAGRTGRVREGNVYRLYTRTMFDHYMDAFEKGEMQRIPLDSVILSLKEMLHEAATPVLLDCLEPPDMSTIHRSFESLYKANFITEPSDDGDITHLGNFVSSLGIDLMLGSLVGLGIQFGVAAEAVELAAVLSFPQSPWIMTSPINRTASDFNAMTKKTFMSKCHFDANLYSEPLATMNLMWDYEHVGGNQGHFAYKLGVFTQRLRRLLTTRNSLRNRVAEFIGIDSTRLNVRQPPSHMPHSKVVILRILQVWVFHENLIEAFHVTKGADGEIPLTLRSKDVTEDHLKQVLDEERHPFRLVGNREFVFNGSFAPVEDDAGFNLEALFPTFMERLVSLAVERDFQLVWCQCGSDFQLIASEEVATTPNAMNVRNAQLAHCYEEVLFVTESTKSRGRQGRASGAWQVGTEPNGGKKLYRWSTDSKEVASKVWKYINVKGVQLDNVDKALGCRLSFTTSGGGKKQGKKKLYSFRFSARGQCQRQDISQRDVQDLFGTPNVQFNIKEGNQNTQEAMFQLTENSPLKEGSRKKTGLSSSPAGPGCDSSWDQPLLCDMPEGLRLLSVLASSRRKSQFIMFPTDNGGKEKRKDEEEECLKVDMSWEETRLTERWKRFSSSAKVFVAENSVVSAALHRSEPTEVYAVAANALEIRGGRFKVEGLTMLPPGRLFVLLALLTFGVEPFICDPSELHDRCLWWLQQLDDDVAGMGEVPSRTTEVDRIEKINLAIRFREACQDMDEELTVREEKIRVLLEIFDLVDGYRCAPWTFDDLHSPMETSELESTEPEPEQRYDERIWEEEKTAEAPQLRTSKTEQLIKKEPQKVPQKVSQKIPQKVPQRIPQAKENKKQNKKKKNGKSSTAEEMTVFNAKTEKALTPLFAVTREGELSAAEAELPSTNILSVLINSGGDPTLVSSLQSNSKLTLDRQCWRIVRVKGKNSQMWFCAEYVGSPFPFSFQGRSSLPQWIRDGLLSPTKLKDARVCIPEHFKGSSLWNARNVEFADISARDLVLCPSLELALRMGAAYWLERQFGSGGRHWFQMTLPEMFDTLQQ